MWTYMPSTPIHIIWTLNFGFSNQVSRCKRTKGDKKLRGSDIVAKSSAFKKDRDVSVSQFPVVLEPRGGPYVLIPMTYEPQADLKYYVTVRSNR